MTRKTRNRAGVIGLGQIGSKIAAGLRGGGYSVYVWNRTPRAEPNFLGSAVEVADLCDIIQLFVPDAKALDEVVRTLCAALRPQHIILGHATVSPEVARQVGSIVEAAGARYLDAPIVGTRADAEARKLVYYIGGREDALRDVRTLLQTTARRILHAGPIGNASMLKLATQALSAVTVQAVAEMQALARAGGISDELLLDALEDDPARSVLAAEKLEVMTTGQFNGGPPVRHSLTGLQLALQLAAEKDLVLPAASTAAENLRDAVARGQGQNDAAIVARGLVASVRAAKAKAVEAAAPPRKEPELPAAEVAPVAPVAPPAAAQPPPLPVPAVALAAAAATVPATEVPKDPSEVPTPAETGTLPVAEPPLPAPAPAPAVPPPLPVAVAEQTPVEPPRVETAEPAEPVPAPVAEVGARSAEVDEAADTEEADEADETADAEAAGDAAATETEPMEEAAFAGEQPDGDRLLGSESDVPTGVAEEKVEPVAVPDIAPALLEPATLPVAAAIVPVEPPALAEQTPVEVVASTPPASEPVAATDIPSETPALEKAAAADPVSPSAETPLAEPASAPEAPRKVPIPLEIPVVTQSIPAPPVPAMRPFPVIRPVLPLPIVTPYEAPPPAAPAAAEIVPAPLPVVEPAVPAPAPPPPATPIPPLRAAPLEKAAAELAPIAPAPPHEAPQGGERKLAATAPPPPAREMPRPLVPAAATLIPGMGEIPARPLTLPPVAPPRPSERVPIIPLPLKSKSPTARVPFPMPPLPRPPAPPPAIVGKVDPGGKFRLEAKIERPPTNRVPISTTTFPTVPPQSPRVPAPNLPITPQGPPLTPRPPVPTTPVSSPMFLRRPRPESVPTPLEQRPVYERPVTQRVPLPPPPDDEPVALPPVETPLAWDDTPEPEHPAAPVPPQPAPLLERAPFQALRGTNFIPLAPESRGTEPRPLAVPAPTANLVLPVIAPPAPVAAPPTDFRPTPEAEERRSGGAEEQGSAPIPEPEPRLVEPEPEPAPPPQPAADIAPLAEEPEPEPEPEPEAEPVPEPEVPEPEVPERMAVREIVAEVMPQAHVPTGHTRPTPIVVPGEIRPIERVISGPRVGGRISEPPRKRSWIRKLFGV